MTNGLTLRLLRDSTLVRRQAYIEFDLQAIFEEQRFHDFAALYRLLHRSRLPRGMADANECLLEKYYAQTIEQGGRVREHLRDGVEECLKLLGNGFLSHPDNQALRDSLSPSEGERAGVRGARMTPDQFYRQLFRLVYRFLFLLVSEDRGLISPNPVYRDYYSIARLRRMLDVRAAWTDHADLWLSLRTLFRLFQDDKLSAILDLAPLNGELFSTQTLDGCTLSNRDLLAAFWYLAYYQERAGAPARRVNYAALDVEELGSVYESLLEFHPDISEDMGARRGDGGKDTETRRRGDTEKGGSLRVSASPLSASSAPASLRFDLVFGSERKTTGSFYTPPELVNELIESALMPVVRERLRDAETRRHGDEPRSLRVSASPLSASAGERALLSLKIIDIACGSGHMLLAVARRVGKELAKLRTGEDEPAPERVRESIRDVISHCIYGVDRNPLAVDLCRVALWLESHTAGKPLTFLDHRIRCGDSLVGVFDLGVLTEGIPDKAFDPCEGDDKPTARNATKQNREERRGAQDLFALRDSGEAEALTRHSRDVDAIPDDSPELIRRKKELFEASHRDPAWLRQKQACDLWTAAFFQKFVVPALAGSGDSTAPAAPDRLKAGLQAPIITSAALADHLGGRPIDSRLHGNAGTLAHRQPFFHWPLEFPEVFARSPGFSPSGDATKISTPHEPAKAGTTNGGTTNEGGFDVVLSNPPWKRIKLQAQEFFAARDPRIATAANKAARSRLITELIQKNPALHAEFIAAVHAADCVSKFLRESNRFPLTARGDINTYAVFAETIRRLLSATGRAGVILPTGIATDDTTKRFFSDLVSHGQLVSLLGFENEEFLFPAVHHAFKFCALAVAGERTPVRETRLAFYIRNFGQLRDARRQFVLAPNDFTALNPNTRTCPVFRTRADAELTRKIYQRVPALLHEDAPGGNPWNVRFMTMFHMANDSHIFQNAPSDALLPLYEAKMMWHFDHRFSTYEGASESQLNVGILPQPTPDQKAVPSFHVRPRYWVAETEVLNRLAPPTDEETEALHKGTLSAADLVRRQRERAPQWLLGFRNITNTTNERTAIFSFLPCVAVGHSTPLAFTSNPPDLQLCLFGNLNSLVFDYVVRQKLGGTNLTFGYVYQLPVLPPSFYRAADVAYVASRVLELVYTADDMQPLAEDLKTRRRGDAETGDNLRVSASPLSASFPIPDKPYIWNEERRAQLRAELDAWFVRAYGLTRDELRYILDPADVHGQDFPGETFRVLKEKEIGKYGEYRTRRLVLEAWDRLT